MIAQDDSASERNTSAKGLVVPLADVLSRAGHELTHIAWFLQHLQILLSPLIIKAAEHDADHMRHMQSLDHIEQKIMGLADFVTALSNLAHEHWQIDPAAAADRVLLADLSARLGFKDSETETYSTAWGECDFF